MQPKTKEGYRVPLHKFEYKQKGTIHFDGGYARSRKANKLSEILKISGEPGQPENKVSSLYDTDNPLMSEELMRDVMFFVAVLKDEIQARKLVLALIRELKKEGKLIDGCKTTYPFGKEHISAPVPAESWAGDIYRTIVKRSWLKYNEIFFKTEE